MTIIFLTDYFNFLALIKRTGKVTYKTRLNIYQYRKYFYKHDFEARFCKHCYCGKAVSITHCECVFVALIIQHAK